MDYVPLVLFKSKSRTLACPVCVTEARMVDHWDRLVFQIRLVLLVALLYAVFSTDLVLCCSLI